jgi:hypothetical protein
VPVGVHNLNGCCHLRIELPVSVSGILGSATRSQSPELGD